MDPEAAEIEWASHPARARPGAAAAAALFVAGFTLVVHLAFADGFLTALSIAIFLGALSPFYLPTRYSIGKDLLVVRTPFTRKERKLHHFRRLAAEGSGALLSPFDAPSRLDRRYGIHLRFEEADRERVMAFLTNRFPSDDRRT